MPIMRNLGKAIMSGKGNRGIYAGAALLGLASGQFSNLNNAAMDVAFGDENADKYLLGGEGLTPTRYMTSGIIGGAIPAASAVTGFTGGLIGGGIGAAIGTIAKNASFEKDVVFRGKTLFKAGKMGSGRAKLVTAGLALGGAALGAAAGGITPTAATIGLNKEFYSSSPYSRGSAMQASSTGAYGDIVLGMHNTRRG